MSLSGEKIALLVLTYGNRRRFLTRVVEAALNGTLRPVQLLVVDNGCQPRIESDDLPSAEGIRVELVRSETNIGSAGGYHLGLATLLEDPEWTRVWILDDDNLPSSDCLERLLGAAAGLPDTSIFVAHRPDRREFVELVASGGQIPPPKASYQGFSVSDSIGRIFGTRTRPANTDRIPMIAFGYGGAIVPRSALQDGNCLPDPRLFLYHDDSEWSWRLGNAGYHAYLCPTATIQDIDPPWGGFVRNGASPLFSNQTDRKKLWYSLRNRAWLERNMGFSGFVHDVNALVWICLMTARTLMAERSPRQCLDAFRVAWRAYRTGNAGLLDAWPFG